jgi:hypothetical protein
LAVVRAAPCDCRDITGRRTRLAVALTRTRRVALTLPAGETVVLTPAEIGRLRQELRAAAVEALVGADVIDAALVQVENEATRV